MSTVTPLHQAKFERIREQARNSIYPEDFLWFWDEYPNKKAKLDALKAWKQTAELRPSDEELIGAIARQKNSNEWLRGYIPHPGTWLRQGRWDDE